jgi:hypothetical protein
MLTQCQLFPFAGELFSIMELQQLTISELNQTFLKTNERYVPFLLHPSETYKNDPYFLYIQEELRNILIDVWKKK